MPFKAAGLREGDRDTCEKKPTIKYQYILHSMRYARFYRLERLSDTLDVHFQGGPCPWEAAFYQVEIPTS